MVWKDSPGSELINKRASEAHVRLVPTHQELFDKSGMVISAVSADMAVSLAEASTPFLKKNHIYVDINATSPMTKEKIDAIIRPNASFVDCAVMGPVPTYKHKVPVSVSGSGAKAFTAIMSAYGMNITFMDAPAGSASASKMFRSIFMKGFVVLLLEMLTAAHRYGVEDDVLESVKETLTAGPLLEVINGLVGRGVIHSERLSVPCPSVIRLRYMVKVPYVRRAALSRLPGWRVVSTSRLAATAGGGATSGSGSPPPAFSSC